MKIIKQASRSCSVDLEGDELWCKSALIGTDYEAYVHLKVSLDNIIKYVQWELYRAPFAYEVKSGEIQELAGQSIFAYSSRSTARFLDPASKDIILELIAEGIRGVLQTNRFAGKGSDNPSFDDFEKKPVADYLAGTCLFHSLPNRFEVARAYIEENYTYPGLSLCHRQKSYHLYAQPDQGLYATACFADSAHEILLTVSLSADGIITEIDGTFLRFPLAVCKTTIDLLKGLKGKKLGDMSKKEIAQFVGGPYGCTHLVEPCYDLALELAQLAMTK